MEISDSNFERVRVEAETFYSSVDKISCPYFGADSLVAFNGVGLRHIKFKSDSFARSRSDQFVRLKHIHLAKRILEKSRTLQEYKEGKIFTQKKSGNSREKILANVVYYGFVAIVNDSGKSKRLKILVRQIQGGEKHFWSIIPFWMSNKELKLHSGNLAED